MTAPLKKTLPSRTFDRGPRPRCANAGQRRDADAHPGRDRPGNRPPGFEAVHSLIADYRWAIDLEICVFPQDGLTNYPGPRSCSSPR